MSVCGQKKPPPIQHIERPRRVSILRERDISSALAAYDLKIDRATNLSPLSMLLARLLEPVAPVAHQVILEPGIGQFREFEPRRVHICINSLGLFLVHILTCGKRESMS